MRKKDENIKKQIIEIAKREFFAKGYKDASMRIIANELNISLGNIYNYFKNKDQILQYILQPLMDTLYSILNDHDKFDYTDWSAFVIEKHHRKRVTVILNLISNYKKELYLLFFNSHGSSYQNFRDEYADQYTEVTHRYLKKMKEKYPKINIDIADFFIHTISSSWINVICELVSHDFEKDENKKFIDDYVTFNIAGWKQLMQV